MSFIRYTPGKGYYNLGVQIKNPGPPGIAGATGPTGPAGAGSSNGPSGTIAFFNTAGSLTGSSALTLVRTTDTVTGTRGNTGPTNLITFDGSILPALNNRYSLGASGMYWRDVYVGTGTIHMGDEITISALNNSFTVTNLTQSNSITLGGDGVTFGSTGTTVTLSATGGAISVITNSGISGDTGTVLDLTHAGITEFIKSDPTVQEHISTIGGPTGPTGTRGETGVRGSAFFYGSTTGTLTGAFNNPTVGDFWINTSNGQLYIKT
jgi:hypothetical protein